MPPYDEAFYLTAVGPALAADYAAAGRHVGDDVAWVVWPARIQADIDAGLAPPAALAKHQREWRDGLGSRPPPPGPSPIPLARLEVHGPLFWMDGAPWRWRLASMFRAAERFAAGEDLAPLVAWTHHVGANGWRVFLQYFWIAGRQAWAMPLQEIDPFVRWANQQGLFLELTLLADCQVDELRTTTPAAQRLRIAQVLEAVRGLPGCSLELVNEPFKNLFGSDLTADLIQPLGLDRPRQPVRLASGRYPVTGVEPVDTLALLDYVGDHPPRKPTWPSECGKTGYYQYAQTGRPSVMDEPMGADEVDDPGRRDSDPDHWADAGAGTALSSAGGTFHSSDGIGAQIPRDRQTLCAERFFAAMAFVPAGVPAWRYTHDGLADHPIHPIQPQGEGESVARLSPDGHRAFVATAQAPAGWDARDHLRLGWQLDQAHEARGGLLALRRS